MDPLQQWFEYLDSVSRPVRRAGASDPEPAPIPWRPWMDAPPEAAPEEALGVAQIPDLLASAEEEAPAGACSAASREAEDPTLHDELQPIPDFAVPSLEAPSFDIIAPKLAASEEASAELEAVSEEPTLDDEAPLRPPMEAGAKGGASSSPSHVGRGGGGRASNGLQLAAARRILAQPEVQADAVLTASEALKAREKLVQRLVDPTLTLEETALILGVCPTTVRRYTNRGVLLHFRTEGNQRRFRLSDVLEFMARRDGEAAAGPGPTAAD